MSNDPSIFTSDAEQREIDIAEDGLEKIDGLSAIIIAEAESVARHSYINVSASGWNDFVGAVEDAVSDLFNNDREKLMQVAGWRKSPASKFLSAADTLKPLPNQSMSGTTISGLMRKAGL